MSYLLLPVTANVQRHLADETKPSSPTWSSMDDAERCQNSVMPARMLSVHDEVIRSVIAATGLPTKIVRSMFESKVVRVKANREDGK